MPNQKITKFDVENDEFSEAGHLIAQTEIYPEFFEFYYHSKDLVFNNTHLKLDLDGCGFLDGEHGIDQVISYTGGYKTFAERLRRMEWWKYKDEFTLTYLNPTGELSEWFKLHIVDYILYGFFDIANNRIVRWLIVDAQKLNACKDEMTWKNETNKKDQQFKAIHVHELKKKGLVKMHSGYGAAIHGIKTIDTSKKKWYGKKKL